MTFKIKDVTEPRFEVEFPDGRVQPYDPWKLQEELLENQANAKTGQELYDGIRKAFGVPAEAEVAWSEDEKGMPISEPFTFTRNLCVVLAAAVGEYLDDLPVSKKTSARIKSKDSSASL